MRLRRAQNVIKLPNGGPIPAPRQKGRDAVRFVRRLAIMAIAAFAAACQTTPPAEEAHGPPHNVIIFVADGLRYGSVNPEDAPALAALRAEGVDFANSHSIYPTLTTANASALATGHYLGDTGNFANAIWPGDPVMPEANYQRVVFLEDDAILRGMNARFEGNYLREQSLLAQAAAHGFAVAAIGKTGPAAIQDLGALTSQGGIVIDETTGVPLDRPQTGTLGPALPDDLIAAMQAANLSPIPPPRNRPNRAQQDWFVRVATEVLIPRFEAQQKPFVMLFWSADPDTTQHSQWDSLNTLDPGINGPTSRAAIGNASSDLERLRAALAAHHLDQTTDIIVVADHGFSTIARDSATSYSQTLSYRDWPQGQLPPGFLAIDLAHALGLTAFQPNGLDVNLAHGIPPQGGSAFLGADFEHPQVIIAANGGSDLIYLPDNSPELARRIVEALTRQDYVASVFVDDRYGDLPGALKLSAINFVGSARTPRPAIVVGFRSYATGCANPELCTAEIADTPLRMGQGMHGSFSRADTRNFMAAIGPDFAVRFVDPAPISNADIAPTVAHILGFDLVSVGELRGRVVTEALRGGRPVQFAPYTVRAAPTADGFATILNGQRVGDTLYFDASGAEGRTVGLRP